MRHSLEMAEDLVAQDDVFGCGADLAGGASRIPKARIWGTEPAYAGEDAEIRRRWVDVGPERIYGGPVGLVLPGEKVLATLSAARAAIECTSDALSRFVYSSTDTLALYEQREGVRVVSVSSRKLPRVLFLAEEKIAEPWPAFGVIVHESSHLKAYEIERNIGPIVKDEEASFTIPWTTGSPKRIMWDAGRLTFACHAFGIQALAYALAVERNIPAHGLEKEYAEGSVQFHLGRATYLVDLLQGDARPALTDAGQSLVAWVASICSGWPGTRR